MTFEVTAAQQALQERTRAYARATLAPRAADIDRDGTVPREVLDELGALEQSCSTLFESLLVVEESAAGSAGAAAAAVLGPATMTRVGLRGAALDEREASARTRVLAAGIAVGIGQAAIDEALGLLKQSEVRPTGRPDEPAHWLLADAATEIEGARLLTRHAAHSWAQDSGAGEAAAAHVFAAAAAVRAVDTALRLVGAAGFESGSRLERLHRDAQAVSLLFGGPDRQRGVVADAAFGPV